MSIDLAFEGVGQIVGLEIWRIEKLKPVPQTKSTYGEFFSGDSYILLNTKKLRNSPKLEWDIHFWLGNNTSQDEKGVAAYKTVELDDSLGGAPVQHREVQEHESKLFLSYFKNGIKYLEGGVDSGFRKVERGKYETRLMHVKGKKNVRVKQVKCDVKSLNKGDVFILDTGLVIFVWNGPDSSRMERIKATEVARRIKDEERGAKAEIKIIEERWETDIQFFKALGGPGAIPEADAAGDDQEFEKQAQTQTKLYRVTDASGDIEIKEVESKPLKKEDLDSQDCFILDTGPSGIYVWVGKHCTKNEKKQAWTHATDFLTQRGYADWTPITQLVEEGETPLFKQYFKSWTDPNAQTGMGKVSRKEKIANYNSAKFDSKSLHMRKELTEVQLPDDGSGNVQIWRVENNEMVPQPEDTYGIFYTGDCYVILYTYRKGGRELYIVYFWQGTKSTVDERGASAIYAQRLDDTELNGNAVQIRVVQGREPEHFLRIFQGKMIIFLGGVNNIVPDSNIKIFHVKGTNNFNTRAAQVLPRAASLNSNDVFIIETETGITLWNGKGASSEERTVAKNLLNYLSPDTSLRADIQEVNENEETDAFWEVLGGKEEYATGKQFENNASGMPPRLFQCSNASGRFNVDEVVDFSQEDLEEDDVMILDTIDEVYVWIGKGANAIERKESLFTAMEYIRNDPLGRSPDNTVILQIKQGFEPPGFTGHFLAWDMERWSAGKSFDDLKNELGPDNVPITTVQEEIGNYDKKHPYAALLKNIPPRGVDPSCKERYLTPEEFVQAFHMSYEKYRTLKTWKQAELKKKAGLF